MVTLSFWALVALIDSDTVHAIGCIITNLFNSPRLTMKSTFIKNNSLDCPKIVILHNNVCQNYFVMAFTVKGYTTGSSVTLTL